MLTRRPQAGHEAELENWFADVVAAATPFPGDPERTEFLRRVERLCDGNPSAQVLTGTTTSPVTAP